MYMREDAIAVCSRYFCTAVLYRVPVPYSAGYVHYKGKYRHDSGSRHYFAYRHTGNVAGNRHYQTGTMQGSILYLQLCSVHYGTL